MPLIHGKSKKAFSHNVEAEMKSGKDQDQSLAIAYSVKRKAGKKKMASGGEVSAANEKRPTTQETNHDKSEVSKNSSKKEITESQMTSRPDIKQSTKGMKTTKIKHPKMVASNVLQTRLRDEEDDLQTSASTNEGPQEQPSKSMDEEGANRQGPDTPALHMKKMAKGGMINNEVSMNRAEEDRVEHPAGLEEDNDQMRPSKDEYMADHMQMLSGGGTAGNPTSRIDGGFGKVIVRAQGGLVHEMDDVPTEEADIMRHSSVAAAIMAKKAKLVDHMQSGSEDMDRMVRMYEGGQVEGSDESQADIMLNGKERPNAYYKRNEDEVLKENYMDDMKDVSQPEDSNETGDERESNRSDKHDMVSAIRNKMKSRRQSRE